MSKRYRLLLLIGAFTLAAALAVWPGRRLSSTYANVTLVSFTASPVPGKSDIDIEWETATEFDTVGFFVTRSASADGTYARVSGFIPHAGDTVVGAPYGWTDRTTASGRSYWYQLEEITSSQDSNYYGPITATAGVSGTSLSTATATPTPTVTPTARPKATSTSSEVVTPRLATGATITPRPASLVSTTNPEAFASTPTLASRVQNLQPPAAIATSLPAASNVSTTVTSAPPPVVADAVRVTELSPSPASVPAAAVPAIIVTESVSPAVATDSDSRPALILIAAAFLFLGIAFVILRQARQ